MGIMDSMMSGVIKALPVEEREALMLKMMPDMMKRADMTKLMPNMLKEIAAQVTLLTVYDFIQVVKEDDKIEQQVKEKLPSLKERMPAMMEMMHPMMMNVMAVLMPKMMGMMPAMMPKMHEMMPQMMNTVMIPMMSEKPEVKEHMLGMMQVMFPHCATNLFPLLDKDQRLALVHRLYGIMAQSGTIGMDAVEKEEFHQISTDTVKEALTIS